MRLEFSQWFIEEQRLTLSLPRDILLTDECSFSLTGHVKMHNSHSWGPRIMVWCGMHAGRLIGPYFFDESVTGEANLTFTIDCRSYLLTITAVCGV